MQLSHCLFLSPPCHQNLLITQNPDAEHRTCTALHKTQRAVQNKYINSRSAKQKWKHKKNCFSYHSSYKRTVAPFWFQLLTIVSSFIGTHLYEHMQLLVSRIVNIPITSVTLITSYTNLSTLKLDTHFSLQTLIHFTRTLLIFRFVISSMIIWCHWMSWQFRLFFFEFADQPIPKTLGVIF